MAKDKKKVLNLLVFLYLVVFPFGVLPGFLLSRYLGISFYIHTADIIVISIFIYGLYKRWVLLPQFINFYWFLLFSFIFSLTFFNGRELQTGVLYFLRIVSYGYFFHAVTLLDKGIKNLLVYALVILGVFICIFGWIQYLLLPDLTTLKLLGWDDHYYRLTSTFLDPAFTGIILVLSVIALIYSKSVPRIQKTLLLIVLLVSFAFTYSRASYLALFVGVGILFGIKRSISNSAMLLAVLFLLLIPFLPRPGGEGVKLERVNSILLKADNYQDSFELYKLSPVFGVGYNNICIAKNKYVGNITIGEHSCSGLDNSFFVVLVSVGIVGLLNFVYLIRWMLVNTEKSTNGYIFIASFYAVAVHALFTNTLFYPWVLGWIGILYGLSRVKEYKLP